MTDAVRMQDETPLEFDKSDLLRERRVVSEFAPKRLIDRDREVVAKYRNLDEIEDTIAQHRRATDQSTYQLDGVPSRRNPLDDIALMLASLPLRIAMEMGEAIVSQADFKAPATKIEVALILNQWAEGRLADPK